MSEISESTAPDLVLRGGRVIDPASGRDEIADVAIANGSVVAIGAGLAPAALELDAVGHVVTAGFIDLHSHVNGIAGLRLQALERRHNRARTGSRCHAGGGSLRAREP